MNGFELAGRSSESCFYAVICLAVTLNNIFLLLVKVSTVHEKGGVAGQVRAPVEQLEDNGNYGMIRDVISQLVTGV